MKKIHVILIAVALLLSFCVGVGAADNLEEIMAYLNYGISVKLDGEEQIMYDANGTRVYPISYNGTTYVPIRAVSNMLGVGVEWDEAANSVLLTKNGSSSTANPNNIARGVINGSTYENSFVGLGFTLPEGWTYATDEQIEATMGVGTALLSEDVTALLDSSGAFCDMMAQSAAGDTINIMIEKKNAMAAADFEQIYNNSIEVLKAQLEGIYENVNMTKSSILVGGTEYFGYSLEGEIFGMKLYQKGFMIDLGDYIATVSLAATSSMADTDTILSNLYRLG